MKNKTFQVFYDDINTLTAEIALNYYDGVSNSFKIVDEEHKYYEVEVISEEVDSEVRRYKLKVDGLRIGRNYSAVDDHHLRTPVVYRYVVRTNDFNDIFYYDGDDLGANHTKENTTFKLWSPVASRVLIDIDNMSPQEMTRGEKGVFSLEVEGDLNRKNYTYMLNINGQWHEATDPYALSSSPNHKKSVVISKDEIAIELNKDKLDELQKKTDAIIYELHVRDFSVKDNSGIKNRGKFLGLTEEGTRNSKGDITGLDYILDLGITHLQLLPIYDFGSVDEIDQFAYYNWGYDPVQYNVPEGSYASDVHDPYSRILDLKKTVAKLHEKGLRVVMDVVYNHMFDRFTSAFESIVPYYYFRIGPEGVASNGSFCGNDFDSTQLMARKYILDSIKLWMTEYGMDGFRFDLMGILDIDTMNQIAKSVNEIDNNAMVYGEGWNMPTILDDNKKATMMNQEMMPDIGHFNDLFRDAIKGATMVEDIKEKGLMTGNTKKYSKLPILLKGSETDFKKNTFFSEPWKSVNYLECHDNHTVYDKMVACGVDQDELISRQKLMLSTVIFSKGIPFIHAGQEFCRTKDGDHNSYMSSDYVNGIDWDRKTEYSEVVNYLKDAIAIRKEYDIFRSETFDEKIKNKTKKLKPVIELHYKNNMRLLINLSENVHFVKLSKEKIIFNNEGKTEINDATYNLKPLELIITERS